MRLLIVLCVFQVAGCMTSNLDTKVQQAAPSEKRIALSFDDGPRGAGPRFSGDERAEVLIEVLASSSEQPAAFFIKT